MDNKRKFKKILCGALTSVLILTMSLPVFASDNSVSNSGSGYVVNEKNLYDKVKELSKTKEKIKESSGNWVLDNGTVVFWYEDIGKLAEDIVDIRNDMAFYHLDSQGSKSSMISEYNPGLKYYAYDFVIYNHKIWQCKEGKHDVTGAWDEDFWNLIIDSDEDTYKTTDGYIKGQYTIYNSILWYAKDAITAPAGDFDSTKWSKVSPIFDSTNYYLYVRNLQAYCDTLQNQVDDLKNKTTNTGAKLYNTTKVYKTGDFCLYNGKLYIHLTAADTTGEFDSSQWSEVDPESGLSAKVSTLEAIHIKDTDDIMNHIDSIEENLDTVNEYIGSATVGSQYDDSVATSYSVGQYVLKDGKVWQCIRATSGTWDPSCWQMICDTVADAYSNSKVYNNGDYCVIKNGQTYTVYTLAVPQGTTVGPEAFNAAHGWNQVTVLQNVTDYIGTNTKVYNKGDMVWYNGIKYICLVDATNASHGRPDVSPNWKRVYNVVEVTEDLQNQIDYAIRVKGAITTDANGDKVVNTYSGASQQRDGSTLKNNYGN